MKRISRIVILLLIIYVHQVYADRGSIPFKPGVKIFEPTQRAMIAWNGEEEILLLSTDLRASESTEILEVLPLPSEPVVKKGDVEVFRKATELINRKLQREYRMASDRSHEIEGVRPHAGEVTFHEKIGAHDVSVTHVLSETGFVDWVEEYLGSVGVEEAVITEDLRNVVTLYIDEGFSWFVFDVVSLEDVLKTNDAIQYRFETEFLFYPVKITRTEEGDTSIDLLVLTHKLLGRFPGIPIEQVRLRHRPVSINSEELRSLNEEMDDLLGHRDNMRLRIWHIQGAFSSFEKDLIAY